MTKTCIICKDEFEAKRDDAKCCSPTCRKRYSRDKSFWDKRDEVLEDVPDNTVTEEVTDKCDKTVRPLDLPDGSQLSPDANTIPLSKGGQWKATYPYKENPGICKYCGKMTYLTTGEIDTLVECCHKCASLKNERI